MDPETEALFDAVMAGKITNPVAAIRIRCDALRESIAHLRSVVSEAKCHVRAAERLLAQLETT